MSLVKQRRMSLGRVVPCSRKKQQNSGFMFPFFSFFGGTLNWSKMVKMVKMVGILGAFLGEKKGEGSWVQS